MEKEDIKLGDIKRLLIDTYACGSCGNVQKSEKKPEGKCGHCGDKQWSQGD